MMLADSRNALEWGRVLEAYIVDILDDGVSLGSAQAQHHSHAHGGASLDTILLEPSRDSRFHETESRPLDKESASDLTGRQRWLRGPVTNLVLFLPGKLEPIEIFLHKEAVTAQAGGANLFNQSKSVVSKAGGRKPPRAQLLRGWPGVGATARGGVQSYPPLCRPGGAGPGSPPWPDSHQTHE